jgi:hypothetical protein
MQHVLTHHPRVSLRGLLVVLAAIAVGAGLTALVYATRDSSTSSSLEGSGSGASVVRSVPAFSALDLAGANQVVVRVGPRRSVIVNGDDNLIPLVRTRVESGTLVVSNRQSFATNAPMSVEVTVPTLRAVRISGAGTIAVEGLRSQRLVVGLTGSGLVRASGRVDRLDASLRGSGTFELASLEARKAHVVVAGTGSIAVVATRVLEASITGTGSIAYGGDPLTVNRTVTGTGTILPL